MIRCRDMVVRNFPRCEVGRRWLVVGLSVLNIYIDVMYFSSLRLERSARGVKSRWPPYACIALKKLFATFSLKIDDLDRMQQQGCFVDTSNLCCKSVSLSAAHSDVQVDGFCASSHHQNWLASQDGRQSALRRLSYNSGLHLWWRCLVDEGSKVVYATGVSYLFRAISRHLIPYAVAGYRSRSSQRNRATLLII